MSLYLCTCKVCAAHEDRYTTSLWTIIALYPHYRAHKCYDFFQMIPWN
jgi:hypothetical protein